MDYKANELKWQNIWEQKGAHKFDPNVGKKYYMLEMFSYPSAATLHVGHWYNFALGDSYARFKKLTGYNVFQPMGFDSFGLPAENYAKKTGIHPKTSTYENIDKMRAQLKRMGAMFDWDHEVVTSDPEYYKWTQELFLTAFDQGLVEKKFGLVNFCPSCNTAIANEQVVDGECERCGASVERKALSQWYFKITKYAEELLEGLEGLDWPARTKMMQTNWIGKSEGAYVDFIAEGGERITVFTTRVDTLAGVTYIVLAPEHSLVAALTKEQNQQSVQDYIEKTARLSDIDRLSTATEKSGAALGSYAVNPLTNERVEIFISDYVLASYGSGAVMGVPAHDTRDFAFAKKYNLPIKCVIFDQNRCEPALPYTYDGQMSTTIAAQKPFKLSEREFVSCQEGRALISAHLESKGMGGKKVVYRLRDWSVSRQRYWGCPIPMIHCEHCGDVPVRRADLPVLLPFDVDLLNTTQSPLKTNEGFINVACPKCGKPATRESDTLDTFVDSSWYFLRYFDNNNDVEAFNPALAARIMPVDKYVGGAEHACMHLLYARFITKMLRDAGRLNIDEPFKSLIHQGMILGADGEKISKSKDNAIGLDECVETFGADILRLHLMFSFNFVDGGPWNEDGLKACARFLERVERLVNAAVSIQNGQQTGQNPSKDDLEELEYAVNYAAQNSAKDYDEFCFNTAIARLMELVNALYKYMQLESFEGGEFVKAVDKLIVMLAPAVPHFAEEMNMLLGSNLSVFDRSYPECDVSKLARSTIELVVQINSKPKTKIVVSTKFNNNQIQQEALACPAIKEALEGKSVKKVIVIPSKLVNIVV